MIYNVLPGEKREMYSFFIQQTARYILFNKAEITQEEEEVLRKNFEYDEIEERYNPILSDPVKDAFQELSEEYIKVYISELFKHPETYIDATLNMVYKLFVPDIVNPEYQNTLDSGYEGFKFERNQIEELTNARELLYKYYKLYEVLPVTNLLSGYGTYNCLIFIIIIYLIIDNRKRELCIYIPIIATIGILILSPVACFRYCLPIAFSVPILLGHYLRRDRVE